MRQHLHAHTHNKHKSLAHLHSQAPTSHSCTHLARTLHNVSAAAVVRVQISPLKALLQAWRGQHPAPGACLVHRLNSQLGAV